MELIKWVVLHPLILTAFWVLGGQEIPQGIQSQSVLYSVDANQSTTEDVHNFDLTSFFRFFSEVEIEEEEEDDEHHYSKGKSSQPLPLPLVLNQRADNSLFPAKKLIKLYILFHSWKSFLFT